MNIKTLAALAVTTLALAACWKKEEKAAAPAAAEAPKADMATPAGAPAAEAPKADAGASEKK